MILLASGAWDATLLPGQGAALAALRWRGQDILRPIPPGGDPNRGFHGAFLMAPWTNRLAGGRISVGGVDYRMPVNRPEEGHALHGFLRERAWQVLAQTPEAVTLACALDHPPFRCAASLTLALSEAGFALELEVTNQGEAPTPMGMGWHPFFARPAGTRLRFAADTIFGRDATNLASNPRPSSGLDGGDAVLEGLDTHFAGWDGQAEITWPEGPAMALRAEGDWTRNLQIFAPAGGGVLCVEPVSHAPDAANNPLLAAHGPMRPLPPGGRLWGRATLLLAG